MLVLWIISFFSEPNSSRAEYEQMKYYDDKTLRTAVANVGPPEQPYSFWWGDNNCQDYITTVVDEYNRLNSLQK